MTAGRRDQLASVLRGCPALHWPPQVDAIADALLPVVDRMIRQAQAEALESAADALGDDTPIYDSEDAGDWLRARAAALRPTTDHLDVTQDGPATPSEPP